GVLLRDGERLHPPERAQSPYRLRDVGLVGPGLPAVEAERGHLERPRELPEHVVGADLHPAVRRIWQGLRQEEDLGAPGAHALTRRSSSRRSQRFRITCILPDGARSILSTRRTRRSMPRRRPLSARRMAASRSAPRSSLITTATSSARGPS